MIPNIQPTYYLPIGGTGHAGESWVVNKDDLFTLFMRSHNFEPLRPGGQPFVWSGKVSGLWFFTSGDSEWRRESNRLYGALQTVPLKDRNILAHSDGGQLVILLAATGFPIRTLTTFGTPNRQNLPSAEAARNITYWQHLYDRDEDWMASLHRRTLGQIGDHSISTDRSFAQVDAPNLRRIPLVDVDHSKLLRDPTCFKLLEQAHVLEGIVTAGGAENGAS